MKRRIATGPIVAAISIAVWVLALACGMRSERDNRAGEAVHAGESADARDKTGSAITPVSAILFVNSLSCDCTREQCEIAETVVEEIENQYAGAVTFETIDYELQYEKAKPLLDKFNAFMIPVLVVLDGNGHVLWKCTDFTEPDNISAQFGKLLGISRTHSRRIRGEKWDGSSPPSMGRSAISKHKRKGDKWRL